MKEKPLDKEEIRDLEKRVARAIKYIFGTEMIRICSGCSYPVRMEDNQPVLLTDRERKYVEERFILTYCLCRKCYYTSGKANNNNNNQ